MTFDYGFAPKQRMKYDGSVSKNIQILRNAQVLMPRRPLPLFESTPTNLQYVDLFDYIYIERKSADWHEGL